MADTPRTEEERRKLERRVNPSEEDFTGDKRVNHSRRDYHDRRQDSKWRFSWLRNALKAVLRD
jgi:hypothetical protein